MLVGDDRFHRRILLGQLCVEPIQRRNDARIWIVQPLRKLDDERSRQRPSRKISEHVLAWLGLAVVGTEQPVSQPVGDESCTAAFSYSFGDAPQVLDKDDPQGDRDRPKLANGQRLDTLVGGNETAQQLCIEATVGVRHESPGDAQDARIAGKRPCGELGKLSIEPGRQVRADGADLPLDQMVVVNQPLRRRCDGLISRDRRGNGLMGSEKDIRIVG